MCLIQWFWTITCVSATGVALHCPRFHIIIELSGSSFFRCSTAFHWGSFVSSQVSYCCSLWWFLPILGITLLLTGVALHFWRYFLPLIGLWDITCLKAMLLGGFEWPHMPQCCLVGRLWIILGVSVHLTRVSLCHPKYFTAILVTAFCHSKCFTVASWEALHHPRCPTEIHCSCLVSCQVTHCHSLMQLSFFWIVSLSFTGVALGWSGVPLLLSRVTLHHLGVQMLLIHVALHHPTCSTTFHKCGFSSFQVITVASRGDFVSFHVFIFADCGGIESSRCFTSTLRDNLHHPRCLTAAHKGIYALSDAPLLLIQVAFVLQYVSL